MDMFAKKIDSIFKYQDTEVYVVVDNLGVAWFRANDVCKILGFANPHQALATHIKERPERPHLLKLEVEVVTGKKADGTPATQKVFQNFVNESGIYDLIFGSSKTEAQCFRFWVIDDVLPSIRQRGAYDIHETRTWEEARSEGKTARKFLTDTIKTTGHLTPIDIARATNYTYKAVTGQVASVLKVILDTEEIRSKLSKETLDVLRAIEYTSSLVIRNVSISNGQQYVDIVKSVSERQMDLLELYFGAREKLAIKDNRALLLDGRLAYTPTELLKEFDIGISVIKFNKLMRSNGFLVTRQRPSTSTPGTFKDYEALSDTTFGINEQRFKCSKLVGYQVKYFKETFMDLINKLK